MASPEQGGNPETPLQRKIRETREFIRRLLGQVDADPQKTDAQKKQEKESMARTSQDELKRKVSDYEKIPESQRDDDKIEEDMLTHVNELAELVKNKVVPHVPEITEAVVIALATKKFDKKKALLIGSIVGEIVDSPEFKSVANRGIDEVRGSLKNLASRLRGEGHGDMADTIDGEVAASEPPKEPPKPPEGPPGGPPGAPERREDEEDDDREDIEKYLNKHYHQLKATRDASGNIIEGTENWLDIETQKKGGYYGLTQELQRSLLGAAIIRQIDLTRRQRVVLRAFDGGDEFRTYFRATREMLADKATEAGKPTSPDDISINTAYKAMSNDVKDIVREFLSTLSGTVDQSSQKETQYIGMLVERISRNIRTEIAGDTEMDVPGKIKLEGTDALLPSDKQTESNRGPGKDGMLIGGMNEYLVPRNVEVSMSEALVDDLASTITKLQKITVGFHNARTFAYSGGSHKDFGEQLKKDGVKPADLVWTFKKEEDVNLGYNLLIQSLQQLKSQTARTVTERYGSMSKVGGLTEAEYRAWIQMLALDDDYRKAESDHKLAQDAQDSIREKKNKKAMDRIKQKKLRAIKMASGIAWGHSREAWGVLLDAKLLVKRSGKGTEDEPFTIGQHYGGSQSSGIEKMLAELHPEMLDDRWGRDKIAPIWMLYQPRDLEAADTGWKSSEPFSHTRIYDLYDQNQKAFYSGRSDDLADFDDEYITVQEFANVTSLHMLRRESWRLRQYDLYSDRYAKEAEDKGLQGMKKHEYMTKRLMIRGGPRLVKMYIDKNVKDLMKDDKKMDRKHVRRLEKASKAEEAEEKTGMETNGRRKAQAEGRAAKQHGLETYYEKFIFDDLSKRFATSLIGFEQPRYMPQNENTLYTALNSYVEKIPFFQDLPANVLQTEIYPVYIDAIHTIERNKWEKYTKSKDGDTEAQIKRQLEDPQDLTDADFDDPDIKSKLRTHYKLNQERIGEITDDKHKLNADFEEYYESLKGFHRKLLQERDKDRYNRVSIRKRKKETLAKRYAHMLAIDQGGINQAMGGSYFDFSLEVQQGGIDAVNRLSSDVNKSAEMTEAWEKLTGDGGALEKFAQSAAEEEDDIHSGAKSIAEAVAGIVKYPYSFSPDQGNEYKVRHEIFWGRAFARPEAFKGLFGPMHEINWKNLRGGQSSLFAEYYQKVLGRTDVTTLDSDQIRIMLNTMEHELRIPPKKLEVAEYESVADMNIARRYLRNAEDAMRHIPLVGPTLRGVLRSTTSMFTEAGVKKYRTHEYNQNMALRELGARKRDIIREKAISVDSLIMLFAGLLAYGKAADEANNKKH
ncbi:hypothetical protein KBD09_00625 [Candidatus Woesebacteria bacterium]|nr:hypothetical protein [Candidatus Woesebacteria bacterium]